MATIIVGGFGTPTHQDLRPWLWVASIVCCSYSILALPARLLAKWEILGIEDAVMAGSYVFAVVYWGLFDRAIVDGLGSHLKAAEDLASASQLFLSSRVVLLCAIYLAKISVLLFERRVFFTGSKKQDRVMFDGVTILTALCGVISLVIAAAGCDFHEALSSPSQFCQHPQARSTTIAVLDAITEIATFALPIYFVSKNTIDLSKKVTVLVLFGFRLLCIPFAAAAATSFNRLFSGNAASIDRIATAAAWSQVLLGWSLTSASIPCMRSFLTAFLAGGMYRPNGSSTDYYGARSAAHNASGSQMDTKRSRTGNTTTIAARRNTRDADEAASIDSDASQAMMIERTVQIDIAVERSFSGISTGQVTTGSRVFPYQGPQGVIRPA